jgi:hypothetical protein
MDLEAVIWKMIVEYLLHDASAHYNTDPDFASAFQFFNRCSATFKRTDQPFNPEYWNGESIIGVLHQKK